MDYVQINYTETLNKLFYIYLKYKKYEKCWIMTETLLYIFFINNFVIYFS